MIYTVAETLKDAILPLGFCERFGGLAVPFEMNLDGRIVRVPVTIGVDGKQCYEQGKLYDLAPNTLYRSVMFFEDQTGSAVLEGEKKRLQFASTLRLLCWLNLEKIGAEFGDGNELYPKSYTDRATGTIVKTLLSGNRTFTPSDEKFSNAMVQVTGVRVLRKERQIFNRYTFADWQQAFVFPFDFFAIDIDSIFIVGRNCFDDADFIAPVDCITTY